jgi:hypothetical protein
MGNRADWMESETESNGLEERVREHWLRMKMAWVNMAVSEIKHLSIFIDVNQYSKQLAIKIWAGSEFFD